MQTREGFTEKIIIGKGVKQGCPLSPSLFNLGIDPLIGNIKEGYQECGYSYDVGKRKVGGRGCGLPNLAFGSARV
jgi:hypothetical protein